MDNKTLWTKYLKAAAIEEVSIDGRLAWAPSKRNQDPPTAACRQTGFVPDVYPGGPRKGEGDLELLGEAYEVRGVLQPKAKAIALTWVNLDQGFPEARAWFWMQALGYIPRDCMWRPLSPTEDELFLLRELGRPGQEEDPRRGELREKLVFPSELRDLLRTDEIRRFEEREAQREKEEAERKAREAQVEEAREVLEEMGVGKVWDTSFMGDLSRLEKEVLWEAAFLLEEGTEEAILKARALWK
jgi:hypothetical protein